MEHGPLIITGTRKGIGRFLAEYYLSQGWSVIGCSREECNLAHPHYTHYCLDIADEKAVRKMVASVVKQHSRIGYLINNAGIASMNHSLLTPLATIERIFRTNVFGMFLFCREVGKIMARQKFGRIVNITTIAVPLYIEGESVYSASKAAVEQLTRVLSKEFGEQGITCNAIGPSPIRTDLLKNIPENKLQALLAQQAIHEFAACDDVANAVSFFLAETSNMITGQILYLGGVF